MIKGYNGTTLIDFPGTISSIIFIGGCNFRCPICHNSELVYPELLKEMKDYRWEEIKKEIEKRKGFIDGVAITGGEPLMYDETIKIVKEIKEMGLKVKVDTNGSFPERLKLLIDIVDYIAMDIKTSLDRYDESAGVKVDKKNIIESIEIIKSSKDYEFRTTVHPDFVGKEDIIKICGIIKGAKRYNIQKFVPSKYVREELKGRNYSDKEIEEMRNLVRDRCQVLTFDSNKMIYG